MVGTKSLAGQILQAISELAVTGILAAYRETLGPAIVRQDTGLARSLVRAGDDGCI